jgi:hypothetical protein
MARLEFPFSTMCEEIDTVARVAQVFIAPSSSKVLPALRANLDSIRQSAAGRVYQWKIPEFAPLSTVASCGEYECGGGGQHLLFARISSVWEIEPLGPRNPGSQPHRKFALAGLASTKVRILEGDAEAPGGELAMWRMEIGDERSPGCCFHVQVLGESDDPPFPRSVPVPRFPGLFLTPMSVLEFVLAELFQETWKEHSAHETSEMQLWRTIQRERLGRLLHWKAKQVDNSAGPAWTVLKSAKPPADLFL